MIFSSIPFLFFFFPIFLLLYYISPFKIKNLILLIFSLIFYAWGEPVYIVLMIFSSVVDYTNGRMIDKYRDNKAIKRLFMVFSIIINLALLGFFKYSDFLIENINALFNISIPLLELGLPIGISFYTFQTMSYSIDVYRGAVKVERNFLNFMTYVSMFPQLIAGPIVRYQTVSEELSKREINFNKFTSGLVRFLQGLFKKVLIANNVGYVWSVISGDTSDISLLTAWLGIFMFAFQIYFDFSGYSDMAIGMGKMLGFTYPENFNYPYISKSITEFWRRWHISLSSWFKDYVYIPLGGSRCKKIINIRNILIVWMLTGIWHGAAWNFVIWGLYFGVLLLIEKFILKRFLEKLPSFFKHIYAIFFILIGWLIFAFDDISLLKEYALKLFINPSIIDTEFMQYFTNYFVIIVVAIIFSMPIYPYVKEKFKFNNTIIQILIYLVYVALFMIVTAMLVSDTYNPFLYFRF